MLHSATTTPKAPAAKAPITPTVAAGAAGPLDEIFRIFVSMLISTLCSLKITLLTSLGNLLNHDGCALGVMYAKLLLLTDATILAGAAVLNTLYAEMTVWRNVSNAIWYEASLLNSKYER